MILKSFLNWLSTDSAAPHSVQLGVQVNFEALGLLSLLFFTSDDAQLADFLLIKVSDAEEQQLQTMHATTCCWFPFAHPSAQSAADLGCFGHTAVLADALPQAIMCVGLSLPPAERLCDPHSDPHFD